MKSNTWADRILRAMDHIHAHLGEEVTPQDLAHVACFSLHHFHRVFRGMVGESVMEYTRRLRMEQAAFRLKYGKEPVIDVAFRSGYESHEGFTRAFTTHFGVPPSEYRANEHVEPLKTCEITTRDIPERCCISLRHVGPYDECGASWKRLFGHAMSTRLRIDMSRPLLGLAYDDPEVTAPEHCRYDACIQLKDAATPTSNLPEGFCVRKVPAGTYAIALHKGPYSSILDTYVALFGHWLPRRGVDLPEEPAVEAYLNSPMNTPPEKLLTEVCTRIEA